MKTRPIHPIIALRTLVFGSAFVGLWVWAAVSVRRFDDRIAVAIPAVLAPLGWVLAVGGGLLTAWCAAAFVVRGRGTPAPFDPPQELVPGGPFRFVRNPMYVGGVAALVGAGLVVSSPSIVLLGGAFFLLAHLLVVLYEEPALTRKFGDSYLRYKAAVRRWLPGPPAA